MTEMTCYRFFLFSVVIFQMMEVCAEIKLTGTVIGTEESVDYKSGAKTTTINTCADVFDGNLETFFASYERSYTWAGLDFGSPHVITHVAWSPRNDVHAEERVLSQQK